MPTWHGFLQEHLTLLIYHLPTPYLSPLEFLYPNRDFATEESVLFPVTATQLWQNPKCIYICGDV